MSGRPFFLGPTSLDFARAVRLKTRNKVPFKQRLKP